MPKILTLPQILSAPLRLRETYNPNLTASRLVFLTFHFSFLTFNYFLISAALRAMRETCIPNNVLSMSQFEAFVKNSLFLLIMSPHPNNFDSLNVF